MFSVLKSLNPGGWSILAICGMSLISYVLMGSDDEASFSVDPTDKTAAVIQTSKKTPDTQPTTNVSDLPGVEKTAQGFEFDEEMKLKLQAISEAYEEQIQYPEFSKPINAEDLETKYLADIPVANELPAKLSDPNSPTLSIKATQLRYSRGESLEASASISGLSPDEHSAVTARLLSDGQVLAYATVVPSSKVAHAYNLDFGVLQFDDVDWKQELIIDTEFQFSGSAYQRSTSIEYINTIASIDYVAASEVEADFLRIPVYITTEKPGFHRVRANLYDATTNEPLVHLNAEDNVENSDGTLVLKAHISALMASGSEGPYVLKDLSLQRLPSKPDYITEFGKADQAAFSVEGHSFSEYLNQPYVNEKAQRIAKELRRLGS